MLLQYKSAGQQILVLGLGLAFHLNFIDLQNNVRNVGAPVSAVLGVLSPLMSSFVPRFY